jgi:hypothetical protein
MDGRTGTRHPSAMRTVGLPDLTRLDAAPLGQLSTADLQSFQVLETVVRQALAHPANPSVDVVAMDEFSHDVLVVLDHDLVLVFDST